jgi:uroporphyrinogen-III decarboxylase
MSEAMTPRQRWLAAVRMEAVDRLPFWPKLNASYPPAQAAPFRDMEADAIQDRIGSDQHRGIGAGVREVRRRTSTRTISDGDAPRRVYQTPYGETTLVQRYDAASCSWHPVDFPVKNLEHVKLMTAFYEDVTFEIDRDGLEAAKRQARQIGESAITATTIGTSPLMHWIEWLAGVADAHLLLNDHRQEVEALFEAMQRALLQKTRLLCECSPADVLYLSENTSTTLISPEQFRRYCARQVGECAAVTSQASRNLVLHMCGHLKALLPDLARIPAQAFEAFTSPSLGDTTLLDGRTACPDKCLVGGTNATLWTRPAEDIIAQIERDLDRLPHHRGIVVTSAGVMPPLCRPETIKQVCEWVKAYPPRMGGPVPTGSRTSG